MYFEQPKLLGKTTGPRAIRITRAFQVFALALTGFLRDYNVYDSC